MTDLEITIISGKSHTKHTEGGDFRKATDIAIRDGLLKVENVLLEPYYKVTLELPVNNVGRAMTDLERMHGEIMPPEMRDDICILSGRVPVATVIDYAAEVASYTGGMGQIMFEMDGYYPCHNADEVIENSTYDYTTDMRHPYQSIYVHGGGPEEIVTNDNNIDMENVGNTTAAGSSKSGGRKNKKNSDYTGYGGLEPDLDEIFTRTYGEVKFVNHNQTRVIDADAKKQENVKQAREEYNRAHPKLVEKKENVKAKKKYILVDCYNVIHANEKMSELANENLDAARGVLLDMLCNYQGFMGCDLIAVFDAYKVPGNTTTTSKYNNIYVVYTKENQTADAYIERTTHEMVNRENADVTVISSDGLVQRIIMGDGARRVSARDFFDEMEKLRL